LFVFVVFVCFSIGKIRNRNINGQGIFSFNTIAVDDLTLVIIPHFSKNLLLTPLAYVR
jgi:hypothetical protein